MTANVYLMSIIIK